MESEIKAPEIQKMETKSRAGITKQEYKLRAKNVDVFYNNFQAIHNISMDIVDKSVTAFIGPSGCGKSTFLRLFNRMNDYIDSFAMNGQICLGDQDIYDSCVRVEELRKTVGMVFQKPNPFPKSIFDNVAYGLRIQGIKDKERIEERVIESLRQSTLYEEVKDNLDKQALALSGGQQQRLCIARALAVKPSVLLMDEPTSALDPISTGKIEDLISELKEKYTIAIVTHNMQQAGRISDHTAFLYMGKLVEYGDTQKIFTNPEKDRTQNYITGRFG
ncbi:MAG TPA: phosphate ABC transporter ATP-binding protein PstB [Fodinibius sp.]|nr:phosphate ABC transporter ATP-binding protein PstB [Fodinibius sp.]